MVQQIDPMCGERRRSRSPHQDASAGGDRAQSLGDRAEQNAVDDRLVLQGNGRQLGRQWVKSPRGSIVCRESRHGDHPATERRPVIGTSGSAGFLQPAYGDALMTAGVALLDMATERRRPADLDRRHHTALCRGRRNPPYCSR